MKQKGNKKNAKKPSILSKALTGIRGFDEISQGGIPRGRTTLISGTSGSGKTVFAAQFLYNGITKFKENGVFVTFEERPNDIIRNTLGFDWNITKLVKENKWAFVDASPDESEKVEVGHYDLGAFVARIEYAAKKVKAKRVVIDSISALFPRYKEAGIIRRELYRLASTLKAKGLTTIMTAERLEERGAIARFGIEEFVSDNVILMHNRLTEQGERDRTIEILKFRGFKHDSREAPIVITDNAMEAYPRPKPELKARGFLNKISTGIPGIDKIMDGGVYKSSTTLISGASGTGKTVSILHFIMQGVSEGEPSLLIEFEESPKQLYRNAKSFGWDLEQYVKNGSLQLMSHYPEDYKPEQYLKVIQDTVLKTKAKRVAVDSLSALQRIYSTEKFREFVIGLNAFLKMQECTSILTNTTNQLLGTTQITESHLSTATDNIIILKYVEMEGQMSRLITVLKARGSKHEKDLKEFEITKNGLLVGKSFKNYEGLLSGVTRKIGKTKEEKLKEEFINTLGVKKGLKEFEKLSKREISTASINNSINQLIKTMKIKAKEGNQFREKALLIQEELK